MEGPTASATNRPRWRIAHDPDGTGTMLFLPDDRAREVLDFLGWGASPGLPAPATMAPEVAPPQGPLAGAVAADHAATATGAARGYPARDLTREIRAALAQGPATQRELLRRIPSATESTLERNLRRLRAAGAIRCAAPANRYRQPFTYSLPDAGGTGGEGAGPSDNATG